MSFRLERFSVRRWGSLSFAFFLVTYSLLCSPASHADTFTHQYTVGKNIGSSVALDDVGSRYVGSADGNLYAISASGEEWSFSTGAEIGSTPAVGPDNVLFMGSYDGHLYAIDTVSRQELWSFDTGYPIYSSAAVSLDGTVFIGNRSGDFFAINRLTGELKWRVQLGAEIGSSPVVGPRGDVYLGAADGAVYALDGATGSIEFEYSTGGGVSSPAVDWFGNVYFGSYGNRLTAIDSDGELLWEVDVDGRIASSPVIAHDGSVIAVTYDSGTAYAVSPEGSILSTVSLASSVYATPAIGPDNSVYVATTSGMIYSLDYSDNNLSVKSEHSHSSGFYSSASLSSSNQLYLVSKNGELLEQPIQTGSEESAQWPMFGYSDRHNRVHPNGDGDHCPDAVDVFPDEADKCFDTDGDGIADVYDDDTDGDGLPDDFELAYGLDPLVDDALEDLDGDGYTNEYEYEQGLDPSENEFDDRLMALVETHDLSGGMGKIAVHPSNDYVVATAGPLLTTYVRDSDTGALTELSSQRIIPTGSKFTVNAVEFSESGEHLYFVGAKEPVWGTAEGQQQLYHYQFDEDNGLGLREMVELHDAANDTVMESGIAYEGTVITEASLALSPQGEHLYLGVRGRGILIFDRDAETGDLSFREHYLNDGTLFDAAYGLVMSEDGAWLYAQGYDELWVVSRDETNGTLAPYREIRNATSSYPERGVVAGLGSTSALYMTGNGFSGNSLIETNHDQVEHSGKINIRYGWLFSNPSAGLAYTYSSSTLSAYYRDGDSLELLGKLSGTEELGGGSWDTAVASPDGRHLYAKSDSERKLIVATAGFKGRERPDRDGDGVEDILDEFPDNPDEWVDTDGDGIGNNEDDDDDGDGVVDSEDAFPLDKNEWLDTDGDGIGNNEDDDDDGDGYKDSEDAFPLDETEWADADNDGIGDNADPDDDNDGMPDVWEEENGLDPLDPSDASLNSDGDNLTNLEEFQNDSDPTKADTDGDGYLDHEDEMPRDPDEYRDHDGDGIGDAADPDDDNDGLSDVCEERYGFDPWVANPPGQDTDNDGVSDELECIAGTDPTLPDTDGDGLPDDFELAYGLDPLVDDAQEDLDGDGYTNEYEYEQGLDPSYNEFDDRLMEVVETHDLYSSDGQVVVHPSGDFVVASAGLRLSSYSRDAETGELTKVSELFAEGTAHSMTFSASGDDLYLTGNEKTSFPAQQLLHHYKFSDSGELTFVTSLELQTADYGAEIEAGVAYAGTPLIESSVILSPQGEHLYLGVRGRGILIFDRDTATGDLSFRNHYLNEGTNFDAAYGLVMSDDGAWLYAQGYDELWVLARDESDGTLAPYREITNASTSYPARGVVAGLGSTSALYMTADGYAGNNLIETTPDQSERSGDINIRYGWLFSNPSAGLAYTYSSSTLSAYYRDGDSLELLGTLSGTEELGGGSWDTAVASPDGQHLYVKSDSNGKLIVVTAGFKGLGHPDSDGDSVPDKDDAFPFDPDEWEDSDGDGYGDNSDAFPEDSSEWSDLDGDGIGDNSDPDIDGDGCLNEDDAFERDPTECLDTDGDGIGNNEDKDDDGDRLPDEWELANGLDPLDATDATGDLDGDGLSNEDEYHIHQTKANKLDTDGDGMDDGWEVEYQLNPNDAADGAMDSDDDGYTNVEEYLAETDPTDSRWYPGAPGLAEWKAQTGDAVRTRAVVDSNGTSYIGSDDGYLYAYDSEGNQLWSLDTGARLRSSPALLQSGEVVIGTSEGELLKIDPLSPHEPMVLGTASDRIETAPEVSEFGIVYFGSDDGYVYSINAETGEELWKYDTGAPVRSSPRIGEDGTVYVGSDSGEVHAIHGESGAPVN